MENTEKKGNAWTNFVKDWTVKNNTPYMVAIKDPVVSQAYKDSKKKKKKLVIVDNFEKLKGDAVAMAEAIDPPAEKKKAGRPSKYANDEERKEAKRLKTLASNKKKREEMSKKKKEGTMNEEEKEKWDNDTEMNVLRTIKMRDGRRGEAIAKYEAAFNKVRDYIEENEDEYMEEFSKDPFEMPSRWRNEDAYNAWKPTGKHQERAVELFGKDDIWEHTNNLEKHILTTEEYNDLFNTHIPNWEYEDQHAKSDLKDMKRVMSKMIYAMKNKEEKRRRKEEVGMREDDPFDKRERQRKKVEAELLANEKRKQERERREFHNEAYRVERAAMTAAERKAEDKRENDRYNRMFFGRGRETGIKRNSNWISLVNKNTFKNN
jgi:hypothetical protein